MAKKKPKIEESYCTKYKTKRPDSPEAPENEPSDEDFKEPSPILAKREVQKFKHDLSKYRTPHYFKDSCVGGSALVLGTGPSSLSLLGHKKKDKRKIRCNNRR